MSGLRQNAVRSLSPGGTAPLSVARPRDNGGRKISAEGIKGNSSYDTNSVRQSSAFGDVGMGFMTGDVDDDSDDEAENPFSPSQASFSPSQNGRPSSPLTPPGLPAPKHSPIQAPIPIAAPKPGYAAPIAALNGSARSPAPGTPVGGMPSPQMAHAGGRSVTIPQAAYMPPSMPGTPVSPLPLSAPITPITPAFARPPKSPSKRDVQFTTPILRGNSEETLLPKRGEKGDDFWRRFSMVVKTDTTTKNEPSAWLKKTQSGSARMSRWVWLVGWLLLLAIGGAIGVGWYFSHKNPGQTLPQALGGSAGDGTVALTSSTKLASSSNVAGVAGASSTPHVTPTNTVQRRVVPEVTPVLTHPVPITLPSNVHPSRIHNRSRRQF